MDLSVVDTTLTTAVKIYNEIKNNVVGYYSDRSLVESTRLTKVEPLTIISRELASVDYMPDVMQTMLSIFAGYYLQTINMLTKVKDIEVVRILDRLNPDRDETGFLLAAESATPVIPTMVLENYKYKLPGGNVTLVTEDAKTINEASNLAVGKLLSVEICYNHKDETGKEEEKTLKIPVQVRLSSSLVAASTVVHLLALKTEDTGLVERYHAWRAGRISFVRDLIFCQDLIDEYKKAMVGDQSGTIQEIIRRVNNSKKYGLLTKNPSLVSASNIFVITEANARELEQKLGGKLSSARIREKAFINTYAMLIAVVDREFDRVTIYTRGIAAATDVSIAEIKAATRSKSGIDIGDVLRSMTSAAPISF